VYAERDIVMANPSVCPSERHTLVLYQNECKYPQTLSTIWYEHDHRRRVSGAGGGAKPPNFFALQVSGTCSFIYLFTALNALSAMTSLLRNFVLSLRYSPLARTLFNAYYAYDVIEMCAPAAPPIMLQIGTHSLNPNSKP